MPLFAVLLLAIPFGAVSARAAGSSSSKIAVFAGGCFWCVQPPFDKLKSKGVIDTKVGYTGGHVENPTYEQVSEGISGHREAIQVTFDPNKISYAKLLDVFWQNIDPYDKAGQFCDKGTQYTSAVFYVNEAQKKTYEASLEKLKNEKKIKGDVATVLLPFTKFYGAEEYHQSYYTKNPLRYKVYRYSCGRDKRLKEVWGQSPHE